MAHNLSGAAVAARAMNHVRAAFDEVAPMASSLHSSVARFRY
jgi:methyl-accepting chemotaxis protein